LGLRTCAASAGRACGNSGKSVGRARPPGPTGMLGTQWLTSASGPCGRSAGSAGRWLYLYAWRARGGRSHRRRAHGRAQLAGTDSRRLSRGLTRATIACAWKALLCRALAALRPLQTASRGALAADTLPRCRNSRHWPDEDMPLRVLQRRGGRASRRSYDKPCPGLISPASGWTDVPVSVSTRACGAGGAPAGARAPAARRAPAAPPRPARPRGMRPRPPWAAATRAARAQARARRRRPARSRAPPPRPAPRAARAPRRSRRAARARSPPHLCQRVQGGYKGRLEISV